MDGTPFPDNTNPPALWDQTTDEAKWQIFAVIGFLEFWSELSTPNNKHYMAGEWSESSAENTYPIFIPIPVPVLMLYYFTTLLLYCFTYTYLLNGKRDERQQQTICRWPSWRFP